MRKQIETFPRPPLIFNAEVPNKDLEFCFREIDFAFKVKNHLFLFECKATSNPIGEEGKIISWITYFQLAFENLTSKSQILQYNIENKFIEHDIFKDVDLHTLIIIKTEGIFSEFSELTDREYVQMLKDLRNAINEGNFENYMEERTQSI